MTIEIYQHTSQQALESRIPEGLSPRFWGEDGSQEGQPEQAVKDSVIGSNRIPRLDGERQDPSWIRREKRPPEWAKAPGFPNTYRESLLRQIRASHKAPREIRTAPEEDSIVLAFPYNEGTEQAVVGVRSDERGVFLNTVRAEELTASLTNAGCKYSIGELPPGQIPGIDLTGFGRLLVVVCGPRQLKAAVLELSQNLALLEELNWPINEDAVGHAIDWGRQTAETLGVTGSEIATGLRQQNPEVKGNKVLYSSQSQASQMDDRNTESLSQTNASSLEFSLERTNGGKERVIIGEGNFMKLDKFRKLAGNYGFEVVEGNRVVRVVPKSDTADYSGLMSKLGLSEKGGNGNVVSLPPSPEIVSSDEPVGAGTQPPKESTPREITVEEDGDKGEAYLCVGTSIVFFTMVYLLYLIASSNLKRETSTPVGSSGSVSNWRRETGGLNFPSHSLGEGETGPAEALRGKKRKYGYGPWVSSPFARYNDLAEFYKWRDEQAQVCSQLPPKPRPLFGPGTTEGQCLIRALHALAERLGVETFPVNLPDLLDWLSQAPDSENPDPQRTLDWYVDWVKRIYANLKEGGGDESTLQSLENFVKRVIEWAVKNPLAVERILEHFEGNRGESDLPPLLLRENDNDF